VKRPPPTFLVDTREQTPLPLRSADPLVQVEVCSLGLRGADYTIKGLEHIVRVERKGLDLYPSLGADYPRFKAELLHLQLEVRPLHRCILVEMSAAAFRELVIARGASWSAYLRRINSVAFRYGFPFVWQPSPEDAAVWLVEQGWQLWGRYSNPRLRAAADASIAIPPKGAVGGANLSHEAAAAAGACPVCFRELPKTAIKQRAGREHCPCGRVVTLPRR